MFSLLLRQPRAPTNVPEVLLGKNEKPSCPMRCVSPMSLRLPFFANPTLTCAKNIARNSQVVKLVRKKQPGMWSLFTCCVTAESGSTEWRSEVVVSACNNTTPTTAAISALFTTLLLLGNTEKKTSRSSERLSFLRCIYSHKTKHLQQTLFEQPCHSFHSVVVAAHTQTTLAGVVRNDHR